MKLDLSQLNWQHYVMLVAGAIGAAATGVAAKAGDMCSAAVDASACTAQVTGVCSAIIAIAGTLTLIFGHTSPSIVAKKDEPS
jgi:hypothetical protein